MDTDLTSLPNRRRKGEEDVDRNADSMISRKTLKSVTEDGVPITRRQQKLQRIEANDARLKSLAKEFSVMVFNDPIIADKSHSSMGVSPDEASVSKKSKQAELDFLPEENARIRARVDTLLEKFLRSKGKID